MRYDVRKVSVLLLSIILKADICSRAEIKHILGPSNLVRANDIFQTVRPLQCFNGNSIYFIT